MHRGSGAAPLMIGINLPSQVARFGAAPPARIDLTDQVAGSRAVPSAGINLRKLHHVFRVFSVFYPNSCVVVLLSSLLTIDRILHNSGVIEYKKLKCLKNNGVSYFKK